MYGFEIIHFHFLLPRKPKPVNPLMMNWLKKANKPESTTENTKSEEDSVPEAKKMKRE